MSKSDAGKLGAAATRAKYGECYSQHMSEIGKIGYKVTTSRYATLPCKLAQWCMVRRDNNQIVSIW